MKKATDWNPGVRQHKDEKKKRPASEETGRSRVSVKARK